MYSSFAANLGGACSVDLPGTLYISVFYASFVRPLTSLMVYLNLAYPAFLLSSRVPNC